MLYRSLARNALALAFVMLPLAASAQRYFDFGSDAFTPRANVPVVVFEPGQLGNYTVTTTVKDMVFDDQLRYSRQLMEQSFTATIMTVPTGFFHIRMLPYNRNVPSGDVTAKFDEMLGCGTYHFDITQGLTFLLDFDLDLTDKNWGSGTDNHFRSILISPEFRYPVWYVHVYISMQTRLSTELIDCGLYDGSVPIRYWELVRFHGGTWSNYERIRDGFTINPTIACPDPNGTPNTPALPYNASGVPNQILVVNTEITDDVTVPAGHVFTVGTEPNPLPYSNQETVIQFASDKGITVESGGRLESRSTGPSGLVTWECSGGTTPGSWPGIHAGPGSELDFEVSFVRNAVKGILFEQASAASLLGCVIERSSEAGLEIVDCSPDVTFCEISQSGELGGAQSHNANIYIHGTQAGPVFKYCVSTQALRLTPNGVFDYGNGVEITGTSVAATFEDCVVQENESQGFYIHDTHGPRIHRSTIDRNGVAGVGGLAGGGIMISNGSFWTTLQASSVRNNSGIGIELVGTSDSSARLRGWWHPNDQVDPTTPSDVDAILLEAPLGENCISNNSVNIHAVQHGVVDLGAPYNDSQANIRILGGHNSICRPGMWQVASDSYSEANLQENWWENDYSIFADASSTADYSNEIMSDEVYCVSDRKMGISRTASMVRDMLESRRATRREENNEITAPNDAGTSPMTAALHAVFPNPFNPTIQLNVTITVRQDVHLAVFDSQGRRVAVLADATYDVGTSSFTFDATALRSGTYHAVLRTANGTQMRTMTLVK